MYDEDLSYDDVVGDILEDDHIEELGEDDGYFVRYYAPTDDEPEDDEDWDE